MCMFMFTDHNCQITLCRFSFDYCFALSTVCRGLVCAVSKDSKKNAALEAQTTENPNNNNHSNNKNPNTKSTKGMWCHLTVVMTDECVLAAERQNLHFIRFVYGIILRKNANMPIIIFVMSIKPNSFSSWYWIIKFCCLASATHCLTLYDYV